MKSLSLKVKSLASKPQVLKNCPVFFKLLKVCRASEKFFGKRLFSGDHRKKFSEDFFFRVLALVFLVLGLGLQHSCLWPREVLSLVGLSLALASDFFVPLALASSLASLSPPLVGISLML